MGFWKHNKNHHNESKNTEQDNIITEILPTLKNGNQQLNKNYTCPKCNKKYTSRQSKWKHEKTCNNLCDMEVLKEQVKQMNNQIQELKSKPNVINNYTTNNTQHNKKIIIHSSPGMESISHLSIEQQMDLIYETCGKIYGIYKNIKIQK